ncbi:MAG: hypothetical protein GSR78_01595 [Desulfurococcales archaeon]|nr:hypothetical protein [Desulfurococcales archaeon]
MVQLQLPQVLTLEDLVMLTALLVSAVIAVAILFELVRQRRQAEPRQEQVRAEEGSRDNDTVGFEKLLEKMGIDRAMARMFHSELKRAMKAGTVKPALVSDKCPGGNVVYDFAKGWMCIGPGGDAYPLGKRPIEEIIEYEDDNEVRQHGI